MPQSAKRSNTLAQHAPWTVESAGWMLVAVKIKQNYKLMKFMHNKIAKEIINAVVHALNAP